MIETCLGAASGNLREELSVTDLHKALEQNASRDKELCPPYDKCHIDEAILQVVAPDLSR